MRLDLSRVCAVGVSGSITCHNCHFMLDRAGLVQQELVAVFLVKIVISCCTEQGWYSKSWQQYYLSQLLSCHVYLFYLFIYLTTIKHNYKLHQANISMKKNHSLCEQMLKALTCKAKDSTSSCKSYYIQVYRLKKKKKKKTLIKDKNTKMRITYRQGSSINHIHLENF